MTDATTPRPAIERLHPRSPKYLSGHLTALLRGRLWLQVMVAMVLGLGAGILLGPSTGWVAPPTAFAVTGWLALPGQIFLALIQMIVIPLVFASIIRGLAATEDIEQLRKTGLTVVGYFIATTVVAIVIGLVLASLVKPGLFVERELIEATIDPAALRQPAVEAGGGPSIVALPQQLLTLLPSNPLNSMVESDMLRVVIFAVIVGIALVTISPRQSKPLLDLLGSLQEVCMMIVRWAMWLAPFAVFGLLAQLTAKIGLSALLGMAVYVGTVLTGLLILFTVYLAIVYFFGGRRPLDFLTQVREVLLLAFSTSSSAAVMPLSIKTAEEKLGVRPAISQFVIPLGATINMNGTALYQGVAAVFLAQVFGIDLGIEGMVLLVITAVGASIGTPATPGVGIVILGMVLATVGVPPAGVALLLGVDRILDMCRTAINVCGDIVASVLMDRWVGGAKPKAEVIAAEERRELERESTGEDIIVGKP